MSFRINIKKMKLKYYILTGVIGMLFVSCNKEKSLKEYMVNSWETTYLKIEMPTFQKSDSIYIVEDKFLNKTARRAQSTYYEDGTFTAWFVNQKGEKKEESNGKWSVVKDSLFIEFFYGGKDVRAAYKIEKTDEGFIGKSLSDWDNDGELDDLLTMKTKRINID